MEIAIRALVVFAFLWMITRSVGRSTLGELSTFELLLYVTMGDLVQQAVTQQDTSVTGAVLAVGTFALATVGLSWVQWRFPGSRSVITGRAVFIIRDGEPDAKRMKRHRVAEADLLMAMREQGIRHTADVEHVILEPNGRLSFFLFEDAVGSSGAPEQPSNG